ncbi:MAG TPA: PQQ-binding-like beta-propeller repeat protein [Pirellulales bacterium]|jgi:outer membrane protein assembly factor BamB|nr:PQQ-binding-like beta-propeller repeat protein [Pirellulales bacterium]
MSLVSRSQSQRSIRSFRLTLTRLLVIAATPLITAAARGDEWPRFRGPTGQGMTSETGLPTVWGAKENKNVVWKAELPPAIAAGRADNNQSSPIVWGDRVFATTVFWPTGKPQSEFPEQHVTCFNLSDGARQWDTVVPHGPWLLADLRGGYGAPTPATDGQRLYVAFGSATIAALDMQGKLLWQKEIADYKSIDVSFASSPILYRDTVLLLCDKNDHASTLTAYDAASGEVRWEKKRPNVAFDHTTPVQVEIHGKPQLLIAASNSLEGVDPENGDLLWQANTPGDVPSPIYHRGLVYSDSGRGGPGIAVDPDGSGDLTKTNVKWKIAQIPEGLSSPAAFGNALYRLHTPAVLRSFDMADGRQRFTARLDGVATQASPIVTAEGVIYLASAGRSYVIKAGPNLDILSVNDLDDPGPASPAAAHGMLILKGSKYLFGIGKK